MSEVRMSNISISDVKDPDLLKFIVEIGELVKEEVSQTLMAKKNAVKKQMPRLVVGGKELDSVGSVISRRFDTLKVEKRRQIINNIETEPIVSELRFKHISPKLFNIRKKHHLLITQPVFTDRDLDKHLLKKVDLKKRFASLENTRIANKVTQSIFDLLDKVRINAEDGQVVVVDKFNKELKLELVKVKCHDETGGWLQEKIGDDEISMGGVSVDEHKNQTEIKEFKVGNFDDGEEKTYNPPKQLVSFTLDSNYEEPVSDSMLGGKLFLAFIAIAEKDSEGFSSFMTELYGAVKDEIELILEEVGKKIGEAIGTAIGGPAGTVIGGILGTLIGIAAGLVLEYVMEWIIGLFKDDVFEPQLATLHLPSRTATFGGSLISPTLSFDYRGHDGRYLTYYRWRLVR